MRRMIPSSVMGVENGNAVFGKNVEVDGDIIINEAENLKDSDGHLILKDLEDAVNGESTITLTFTDEEYDEDEDAYVKRIEVNNAFIKIVDNTTDHGIAEICNPYFKILFISADAVEGGWNNGFGGLDESPEDRYVFLDLSKIANNYIAIFNGILYVGGKPTL